MGLKNKRAAGFFTGLLLTLSISIGFAQTSDQKKAMAALGSLSDSYVALSEYVGPATVQIFSRGYAPGDAQTTASILATSRSSGSGVILDPNGYIITNAHVVEGATDVEVLLAHNGGANNQGSSILRPRGEKLDAEIVGVDRETDLAVLKIAETNLPHLKLGDSESLRQGQIVMAFGSPLGLENSVTMGVISSVARQLRPEDPMIYIQTDAPINPGNSGGPLVSTSGMVVGINTLILSQSGGSEGLGFAAPSNIVKNVYEEIKKFGRVKRGMIGVYAQTITPLMARGMGFDKQRGVLVGDVIPGSPASFAGIKAGDIIFSLNGKFMENGRQFDVNLYKYSIGEQVNVEIVRGAERKVVQVEVAERPDDLDRFVDLVNPQENLIPKLGILGIDINRRIEEMLPGLRKRFGVLVAAISADTPIASDILRPGDVIYSINGTEVTSLSNLRTELDKLSAGDAVVLHIQRLRKMMYLPLELER